MSYLEDPLWKKVLAFEFNAPDSSLKFSQRLARENAWNLAFAQRVIHEYRRFLFLAARAGHAVTPSDQVDQVWHLHLVYTHSYWGDLCPNVLGRPLHHGPTKGGNLEDTKFRGWYIETLSSYQRVFGMAPPADIWPDSETRFSSFNQWTRVNAAESWVLPKVRVLRIAACLALIGVASSLIACHGSGDASTIIGLIAFVVIIAVFAYVGLSQAPKRHR